MPIKRLIWISQNLILVVNQVVRGSLVRSPLRTTQYHRLKLHIILWCLLPRPHITRFLAILAALQHHITPLQLCLPTLQSKCKAYWLTLRIKKREKRRSTRRKKLRKRGNSLVIVAVAVTPSLTVLNLQQATPKVKVQMKWIQMRCNQTNYKIKTKVKLNRNKI